MKQISFKNKFGYMMGDVANGLTFGMSAGFLLAFYTDALGITAAAAGTLFLIARLWDAINDPMMGVLTDKMFRKRALKHKNQKVDKFKIYLLKGSWPVIVAAILMFFAPDGLNGTQKLIWAYATYIVWGMTYTFVNIPYGSLAAVMTQDPVERSSLAVARGIGGLIGNILPRLIVPLVLVQFTDELSKGYLIAMILFGVIGLVSYIISYYTVEENIVHQVSDVESTDKDGFVKSIGVLVKNRPFVAVSIASIAMLLGMMVNSAMAVYYFKDNLNALQLMSITGLTGLLPMLILAPIMSKVVKKFGVKRTVATSSLISSIIYGALFLLPSNAILYISVSFMAAIFMTIPHMLVWGMVSDCIDYNQYLCGKRQEGVIYGCYSFVRKMGQAFAGFFAGVGLSLIGYVPNAIQTSQVLWGIKFLTIGLPAFGMFIAFIAYQFIWNLTPEKQKEVVKSINM
ncbi:glycoside-pentoside-hexuronide (GPH):cation symporter [Vallitalea okinawensis]|uniref:glycoside-pentoside-hexuronide (GPH):cation symporter n=1 Tax=Vallitalea okinawensis TaxID=2078660 RepID=UPI0013006EB7|nr:glycoside-pentoside-hexuronide (GPH):cation symporter [Vallitalea okinawensis]